MMTTQEMVEIRLGCANRQTCFGCPLELPKNRGKARTSRRLKCFLDQLILEQSISEDRSAFVLLVSRFEAMTDILDGEEVSDFMLSFPEIRQLQDLKDMKEGE